MSAVRTHVAATLLALAMTTAASAPASARTVYDGVWSVVVAAESGTCSGAYRYPVEIVNGYVRHANPNDASFAIRGRVGAGGRVQVAVRRGDQHAFGVGRLARFSGGGTWQSPNGCAGHWEASRRD